MADANTKLYASQGNGGKATVSIDELGGLITPPIASTTVAGIVLESVGIPALTDDTGGTASSTLAAIAAGTVYAQADMVAAKNALASLAAQYNDLISALQTAGLMTVPS